MNRPPLANVKDDLVNYILYLEDENGKLKAENAKLKRDASLQKMKASLQKKGSPPSNPNDKSIPPIGIIVHPT